ncbi:MAG: hypothetical protein WD072_01635 [Pirellulales bacterium]
MFRLAEYWCTLAEQKKFVSADEARAIKKHAAGIYMAAVGDLPDAKDIKDADRLIDRDSEFLKMAGGKRPPGVKLPTAAEIFARPPLVNSVNRGKP